MIGICVAVKLEWMSVLNYFKKVDEDCHSYPFGNYFIIKLDRGNLIFYFSGVRKVNSSAATQYMIDKFNL